MGFNQIVEDAIIYQYELIYISRMKT